MEFRRVLFRSRISHPHETETREYDKHKRLRQRTVSRAAAGTDSLRYTESFEYDAAHRLRRHHLPEGGSLEYRRSEEHTSELQSLMRISYAVFCLKTKTNTTTTKQTKNKFHTYKK